MIQSYMFVTLAFEIFGTLGLVVVLPFYLLRLLFETSNFRDKVSIMVEHINREQLWR